MNSIVEISNHFIDDLKKLAALNKVILNNEEKFLDRDFALQLMHPGKSYNDISTIRSKDPSAERAAILKRRRTIKSGDCNENNGLKRRNH